MLSLEIECHSFAIFCCKGFPVIYIFEDCALHTVSTFQLRDHGLIYLHRFRSMIHIVCQLCLIFLMLCLTFIIMFLRTSFSLLWTFIHSSRTFCSCRTHTFNKLLFVLTEHFMFCSHRINQSCATSPLRLLSI